MADRFHKAARDGFLDALKEATRKDCNHKDEDGMTPTLWAAFEGNLEALRLLVGRGGDPERCDNYGNTGLHLASAKGHTPCVTFLINFGVSLWALDIDQHNPKELAAINNKDNVLKMLDVAIAHQEATNSKLAKSQKEKAKREAEKNIKNFQKIQKKADKNATKENEKVEKEKQRRMSLAPVAETITISTEELSVGRRPSLGVLTGVRRDSRLLGGGGGRYSDMVGTVNSKKIKGGVFKKLAQRKVSSNMNGNDDFTVTDMNEMDGKRTVRSLAGLRRDSEIMFIDKGTISKGSDTFSSNIYESSEDSVYKEQPSIFNRPGFGSVAFRNSMTAFNAMSIHNQGEEMERGEDSIGSAGSLAHRSDRSKEEDIWEEDSDFSDDDDVGGEFTSLTLFLAASGLQEWIPKFISEKIDLDALMLLSEQDLEVFLKMPLGPRRKLLKAVSDRKSSMDHPDSIQDSHL